jgi:molybdenum cofactor biosynthesis protein B
MNSTSTKEHREQAGKRAKVSVLTVSDTRTLETDTGGKLIADLCEQAGYEVVERTIVIDDLQSIRERTSSLLSHDDCDAVLITGGTGLAARDQTVDAVESLYDNSIPGYGELFRMLSYQEIGPASMLSRASAGRVGKKLIFTMPGSVAGVRLAMEKLIVPELPHLIFHAGK